MTYDWHAEEWYGKCGACGTEHCPRCKDDQ